MEALTINIVLQLMDGIKISKTFIPTRYGLKILLPIYYSQNQVGLALAYRKKNDTHLMSSDKSGRIVSLIISQDHLVPSKGPRAENKKGS